MSGKTLADALAQVILAYTYLCPKSHPDPVFKMGQRLLYSVKNILERKTGLSGAIFAADRYMPDRLDPHGAETEKAA